MKRNTNLPDMSKVENQIGCGWCYCENHCPIHDSKINKAKLGCPVFEHYLQVTGHPILSMETRNELKEFDKKINA